MSRFFVGQRVRVKFVKNPRNAKFVGREGVVNAAGEISGLTIYGLDISPLGVGPGYGWLAAQLEPVIGPKHEACDDEFKRDLDKLLEGLPA